MLGALIINLLKSIFGIFFNETDKNRQPLTEREAKVFGVKLSAKSKEGWIERIDYWIDNKNYDEAVKLCNYYTQNYFGYDDEIEKRVKRVNALIVKEEQQKNN